MRTRINVEAELRQIDEIQALIDEWRREAAETRALIAEARQVREGLRPRNRLLRWIVGA